jgi:hypothetical protein
MEVWKEINGYINYSVSNLGNVKNNKTGRIMKQTIKRGYYHISLANENIKNTFKVHRLVAFAFIENPENKSDVYHKDKNKLNNNLNNLEWMTRKENNIHRCEGLKIISNKRKSVLRIDKNTDKILEKYDSIELAGIWAFENKYTKNSHNGRNAIGNCLNGMSNLAYNFKWKYENNYEDLEGEIWKEIILENISIVGKRYFVSNLGRFKNSFGIIMDNYKVNENGYIKVYVYNKSYALHRVVALTFIENPENKEQVNHIDGNKINNSVNNLEWVTNKENQIHKFKTGLGNNYTRKIIQYDLEMNEIKQYNSIVEASNLLNIGKSNIRGVLNGSRKTAGGFVFKYIEDKIDNSSEKIIINKNRGRKVVQYDLNMNTINIHNSIADAGRNLNIHKNNIWGVINNYKKTSKGFIFKYLEEIN